MPPGRQQLPRGRPRPPHAPGARMRVRQKRIQGCGRHPPDPLPARPSIVEIGAAARIPEIAIDRGAPHRGAPRKFLRAGCIGAALAPRANRVLETEQQTVQIDRHDFSRIDGRAGAGVGEPARAEIPAAFRRCAYIAEHLRGRASAGVGEIDVVAIRLIARRIAIVPIAVENRAVGERHDMPACGPRAQPLGSLHPECVLGLQLRQIADERRRRIVACEQSPPFRKRTAAASDSSNRCARRSARVRRYRSGRRSHPPCLCARSRRSLSTRPSIVKYESQ